MTEVPSIRIACTDNVTIAATLFKPDAGFCEGVVIICSALGVPRKFYHKFARFLCSRNFCVITFDYRGTGDSKQTAAKKELLLEDWGRQDIDAMIRHARTLPGSENIFLVGHSIGGQLFYLAPNAEKLKGVLLVGASFSHWSRWSFPRNLMMFFFFYFLIPILSIGRKEFPLRMLGLSSENIAVSLISSWGGWARNRSYVTAEKFNIDTRHLRTLAIPILSMGFDDDTYAPPAAIRKYHEALESAVIHERYIRTKEIYPEGIGHFGFFKEPGQSLFWTEIADWMVGLKKTDPEPSAT